jgi:hypothetical protein
MEQREVTVIKARPKFDLDKNGFKVIKKRVALMLELVPILMNK